MLGWPAAVGLGFGTVGTVLQRETSAIGRSSKFLSLDLVYGRRSSTLVSGEVVSFGSASGLVGRASSADRTGLVGRKSLFVGVA